MIDSPAAGHTVTVDGLRIFYRSEDRGGDTPFVLTHGIPRSSFVYRKLIPLLAHRAPVVAWDLYGAGLSDKPQDRERYRFSEFERIFGLFLEELGIQHAHLVCHDVGGPFTMGFAARNPKRVASLTILNTTLTLSGFHIPAPVAAAIALPPRLQSAVLPDERFSIFLSNYIRRHALADVNSLSEEDAEQDRHLLMRDGGRMGLIRTLQAYRSVLPYLWGVRRALSDFKPPCQILWGGRDPFCLSRAGENIAKILGGARMKIFENASHYVQEDVPEEIASALVGDAA